jgi:diguanylate cyclase (GGDEF)-like protein
MHRLINSVGDLTFLRDREGLEITLASVLYELLGAQRLVLWRVAANSQGLRLRQRAALEGSNRVAISETHTPVHELPLLDSVPRLKACFDAKVPIHLDRNSGRHIHVFPISSDREVIGLLEVEHVERLREDHERLVTGMLRVYRNHLSVLDYSEHDELTGLLNRKTFEGYFNRMVAVDPVAPASSVGFEWRGARRPPNPDQHPWIAVIDIDFFKRINDRFGHLYGDEVLLLMARLMRANFRESDRLFRFGGEEFVVLLGHTESENAGKVMDRFRKVVEAYRFPQLEGVTISIGYTCASGTTGSTAFERADEALYIAKGQGRNQVRCFETLIEEGVLKHKVAAESEVELF